MPARFSRPLGVQPSVLHDIFGGDFGRFPPRWLRLRLLFGKGHRPLLHIDGPSFICQNGFCSLVVVLGFVFLLFQLLEPLRTVSSEVRLLLHYLEICHRDPVVAIMCLPYLWILGCVVVPGRNRPECASTWLLVNLSFVGDNNAPGSHDLSRRSLYVAILQGGVCCASDLRSSPGILGPRYRSSFRRG